MNGVFTGLGLVVQGKQDFAGHFRGGGNVQQGEDGGSDIAQFAVSDGVVVGSGADEDAGHGVHGVGGIGGSVFVEHAVGVAVVGEDEGFIALLFSRLQQAPEALVHRFGGFDSGFENARVPHHVRVGVVQADEVGGGGFHGFDDGLRHFVGAHFGLEVVGGHLGGGDEDAAFAGEDLFAPPVEEERNVGVFFGFGDANLGETLPGEHFAESVDKVFRFQQYVHSLERVVVAGHGQIVEVQLLHAEFGEVGLGEGGGELAQAVGSEVEAEHHVAILDGSQGLALRVDVHDGFEELVGFPFVIAPVDGGEQVLGGFALAMHEQVVGQADALPAFVPVHGVIAAHHGSHLCPGIGRGFHDVAQISFSAFGVGVAAIHESMDEDLRDPRATGETTKGNEVLLVGVNAPVRDQPQQVEGFAAFPGEAEGLLQNGVALQFTVFDGFVDAHQLLIHHPTGAEVHVAHFGVAHLTFGQADGFPMGDQLAVGVLL